MDIQKKSFGNTPDGKEITKYTLTNDNLMRIVLINYGAILVSLENPDRDGNIADITLGYDDLEGYLDDTAYLGATIGRYGNRIAKGVFILNGKVYKLATNNGNNHLHGGIKGFNRVVWDSEELRDENAVSVIFKYLSNDVEEGYPGNLLVKVKYTLNNENELKLEYEAETDKPTVVNLTHHSYFNLAGQGKRDVLDHIIMINADKYIAVDDELIPKGAYYPVEGTPMNFQKEESIGKKIKSVQGGYDHSYALNKEGDGLSLAARVYEPETGRIMEILTTEPGLQFYSGNFLDGTITGKNGRVYSKNYGFCLETQHFPDSPNIPEFPSTVLNPGEKYTHVTVHRFSTK